MNLTLRYVALAIVSILSLHYFASYTSVSYQQQVDTLRSSWTNSASLNNAPQAAQSAGLSFEAMPKAKRPKKAAAAKPSAEDTGDEVGSDIDEAPAALAAGTKKVKKAKKAKVKKETIAWQAEASRGQEVSISTIALPGG